MDMKKCPYCGRELPEAASFCPWCARSINERRELKIPRRLPRRARLSLAVLLAALAAGAALGGLWYANRPQVLDGGAEILYQDGSEQYRLIFNWPGQMDRAGNDLFQEAVEGEQPARSFYQCFFVLDPGTGANLKDAFMDRVEDYSAQFLDQESAEVPCTVISVDPSSELDEEAALTASIQFAWNSPQTSVLQWTVRMKNGDVIRARQNLSISVIRYVDYFPEGYPLDSPRGIQVPMDTARELQDLVDELAASNDQQKLFRIHLPPVTYAESVVSSSDRISFYGSAEGRTVFAKTLNILRREGMNRIVYVDSIDFRGDADSIGLSTNGRAWVTGCGFEGWKTGLLAYGEFSWVNMADSVLTDNGTAFHFMSTGSSAISSGYYRNDFRNNGTAVLLEKLPGIDFPLQFDECTFSGNGTDIDNRCGVSITLDGAQFE